MLHLSHAWVYQDLKAQTNGECCHKTKHLDLMLALQFQYLKCPRNFSEPNAPDST